MKDLSTIVVSFIGIVVSLFFLVMGVCAFIGVSGLTNIILALVFLAIGIAVMVAIVKLNRPPSE